MQWDPKFGYSGPLIDLLEDLFERFVPDLGHLEQTQKWVLAELAAGTGPFPCRHFSTRSTLRIGPKVNYFRKALGLPFDVIASDNECTSSLYASLRSGKVPLGQSILSTLRSGTIKIGIYKSGITTQESLDAFKSLGILGRMNDHPMRVALHNLTLCHLADAAKNLEGISFDSLAEEMSVRIFRSLSPLNVFPFPHPSSRANGYLQDMGGLGDRDLGSDSTFQNFIFNFLISKWGGPSSEVVQEWVKHSKFSPRILAPENFAEYGAQSLAILPREVNAEAAPSKHSANVAGGSKQPNRDRIEDSQYSKKAPSALADSLHITEGQLKRLNDTIKLRRGDLETKNADFETNSRDYFFVIEKPGANLERVKNCLSEVSGGILVLKGLQSTGRADGKQFSTQFGGCYVVLRGARIRTNRFNWFSYP